MEMGNKSSADLLMFFARLNDLPQTSHWWGFSFEWVSCCWTRFDFRVVWSEKEDSLAARLSSNAYLGFVLVNFLIELSRQSCIKIIYLLGYNPNLELDVFNMIESTLVFHY